jgi:hypothetical protein
MPKVTRQPDGGVSPLPEAEARMVIASQQERIRKMDALLRRARPHIRTAAYGDPPCPKAASRAHHLLQEMNAQ